MTSLVFETSGNGLYSNVAKPVKIEGFDLDAAEIEDGADYTELRVFFNVDSWDVRENGLIYTDSGWLKALRDFFTGNGIDASDVDYSEQGMQGGNFVSLDVGKSFVNSFLGQYNKA